jgi:hemerythrin-like metal-binding protein
MQFETGHAHIDEHHEELFNLTSMLDHAVLSCRRTELNPIIQFLEHYSVDHFHEEETVMKNNDYIGYALHKAEHEKFKSLIYDLRQLYDTNKPSAHIIFFIRKIIDQLMIHIKTIDIGIKDLPKAST